MNASCDQYFLHPRLASLSLTEVGITPHRVPMSEEVGPEAYDLMSGIISALSEQSHQVMLMSIRNGRVTAFFKI